MIDNKTPYRSLRPDLDWSSVGHSVPDLVKFCIRHGDAAVRPILQPMSSANGAKTVGQSVNTDVASRRHPILAGKSAIMLARIRNVDRLVELALSIAEIQNVHAFGRLVISLSGFGSHGIATESNLDRS